MFPITCGDIPMELTRRRVLALFAPLTAVLPAFAIESNESMPHFVVKTLDGERITNDSVKGKVLLIEFWATWCPPCKSDQPVVENLSSAAPKPPTITQNNSSPSGKRKAIATKLSLMLSLPSNVSAAKRTCGTRTSAPTPKL
jgi:thiol-disulfide isomerase/thioredoxin